MNYIIFYFNLVHSVVATFYIQKSKANNLHNYNMFFYECGYIGYFLFFQAIKVDLF